MLPAVALLGGAATALAFAPTRWSPLVVIGPALGLWAAARAHGPRSGAGIGLAYGLTFSFIEFRWMLEVDLVAGLLLPAIQACFWAVTGAVVAAASRRLPDGWWVAVSAATWTLVEAARAHVPLTGFEWGQLSMAAADLPVRSAAAVVGALGLTGLIAACAAGLAVLARTRRPRHIVPVAVAALLLTAVAGVGGLRWTTPDGELEVAVVQVDDPCPGAFAEDCPGYADDLLRGYVRGTASLRSPTDLVLWGEDALRGADTLDAVGGQLEALTGGLPAPLLAGTGTPAADGRFLRWAALFDRDGTPLDGYAKRVPVPFGEYVPMRSLLGGISDVGRLVPSDIEPGADASPVVLPLAGRTARLGTVVSWEVTFSRLVRDVARDANGLATLTTVSSYGTSAASDQLLDAARLRAAEHDKPMVVAATTGRSAIITPHGELAATSALFRADRLTGTLPLRTGLTPYARAGDGAVVLCTTAVLAAAWALRRRRASAPAHGGATKDAAGDERSSDAVPR